MKKATIVVISLVCALTGMSSPVVSGVTFTQAQDRLVSVSYSIDEPAIITVDVRTNRGDGVYASIGADKLRRISGEVNKLVTNVNTSVSATWPIDSSMPEQTISSARVVVIAWGMGDERTAGLHGNQHD